jgi:hypothetical protein
MRPSPQQTRHGSISLRGLKGFAERAVPHDAPLYTVLISEKDELPPEEYASKSEVWFRLIDITFPTKG